LKNKVDKKDIKNLKKRYLLWFYKTSKEALDRIERKFTQIEVDRVVLGELKKSPRAKRLSGFIREFQDYIANKEREGSSLKYCKGKELKPEYEFLALKLKAVEKAIIKEFGTKGLVEIKALYEKEMTERILKATEH